TLLFPHLSFPVPAPSQISTLSLHDALPISADAIAGGTIKHPQLPQPMRQPVSTADVAANQRAGDHQCIRLKRWHGEPFRGARRSSEEHTSELQSRGHLVCRLLLEKKKNQRI